MKKEKKIYLGVEEKDYTKVLSMLTKAKITWWAKKAQFDWVFWGSLVAGFLFGMLICSLNTCS